MCNGLFVRWLMCLCVCTGWRRLLNGATYFFGIFSVLVRLSCLRSLHAIGSFFLRRHGKHEQHRDPVSSSDSFSVIVPSLLVWILLVFRQQNTLAKHNAHLPRSLATAAPAAAAVVVTFRAASSSIVITSSIILFAACLLLRLQHFIRFQHESAAASALALAFFSLSCNMDVAISVAFCSSDNFLARLQHDNFFNRRHGKHNADA